MKLKFIVLVVCAVLGNVVVADQHRASEQGLVTIPSQHSAAMTLDRLEAALMKNGIGIVARVDHAAAAEKVGIAVRPTQLLIFGNPKLGSHMFTSQQTAGIDLPLKALAWEDAQGKVWLTYNDPAYIARRHGIAERDDIVAKMTGALGKLSGVATGP